MAALPWSSSPFLGIFMPFLLPELFLADLSDSPSEHSTPAMSSALCSMLWVTKDWVSPRLQGGLLFEGSYMPTHKARQDSAYADLCANSVGELGGVGVLGRG